MYATGKAAGRPQNDELTEKILGETQRVLQVSGYSGLNIEHIAAATGCGKSTIYRRWPNKAELAAAALILRCKMGELPDFGNVVDDLIEHAWQNAENQMPDPSTVSAPHAMWAAVVVPEVREIFARSFLAPRREMGREIMRRAIARGEMPDSTDIDAVIDLIAGVTLHRNLMQNIAMKKQDFRPIVEALVASPPLLAGIRP